MITKVRQKAKSNFEKDSFDLINNTVFWKTMKNVRKHRNIKLVTTERRINYLVSEPSYHTTKSFTENLLTMEMRKTQILMNKLVYLGLSILDLSKSVMHEFWYNYVKLIIWQKCKTLLYEYIRLHCSCTNKWYLQRYGRKCWNKIDTSNFELGRPLPKEKN